MWHAQCITVHVTRPCTPIYIHLINLQGQVSTGQTQIIGFNSGAIKQCHNNQYKVKPEFWNWIQHRWNSKYKYFSSETKTMQAIYSLKLKTATLRQLRVIKQYKCRLYKSKATRNYKYQSRDKKATQTRLKWNQPTNQQTKDSTQVKPKVPDSTTAYQASKFDANNANKPNEYNRFKWMATTSVQVQTTRMTMHQ